LIDALWGENPPPSAPKLLQIYVSQLRKTLPPAARVQTRGAGYALELERGSSVDATRLRKSAERWPRGAACGPSAARGGSYLERRPRPK
jgi:DNA-binding SARP family transcriptional activator